MRSVECRLRRAAGDRWGVVQVCGGEGGVGGSGRRPPAWIAVSVGEARDYCQ
jgi:hypothetical protein